MAGLRVHFVMPQELVARIDAALSEGQSRGEFVRRAVEQALGGVASGNSSSVTSPRRTGGFKEDRATPSPTPAEQPTFSPLSPRPRSRSSAQVKGDIKPIPKGGKS